MTKIISLVGISTQQVQEWRGELLKMARETGKAPKELAEGLFFVTSAGMRGTQALQVLRAAAQASAVGLGSTATVADAVTSALNAYGTKTMSASKATAILVAAVREGKAAADEIAPSLGRVLPVASQLGVGFDQVAASIAAMTRVGLSADESATALRAVFTALLKPSAEASRALESVGLSASGLREELASKGLLAVLTDLRTAFAGNDEAIARVFGNVRGLVGALNLTGANAAATQEIFQRLAQTTGQDLAQAFKAVAESPSFKLTQALASILSAATSVGQKLMPILQPVFERVTAIAGSVRTVLSALPGWLKKAGLGAVAFAAALGPLMMVLGAVASTVATLGAPLVVGIAAAAAAVVALGKNWKRLAPIAQEALKAIQPIVSDVMGFVVEVFQHVKAVAADIWPEIKDRAIATFKLISAAWQSFGVPLKMAIIVAWRTIKVSVLVAIDEIGGAITALAALLHGDIHGALDALKKAFSRVWADIKEAFESGSLSAQIAWWQLVKGIASSAAGTMRALAAVGRVFSELPFIDPLTRKAFTEGTKIAEAGVGTLTAASAAAVLTIDGLKKQLADIQAAASKTGKTVTVEGSAFISFGDKASGAADRLKGAFSGAGETIRGKLSGGFGMGVQEGISAGEQALAKWREKLGREPVKLKVELDLDQARRQLDDLMRGRIPDTSGALP